MYANHGFMDGSLDCADEPATPALERLATVNAAVEWLPEAHSYLVGCIRDLSDDCELEVPRKAHWGGLVPTYHIIVTMPERVLHHAGEINRTYARAPAGRRCVVRA